MGQNYAGIPLPPKCPPDVDGGLKDLTAEQRAMILQAISKFKTQGVPTVCAEATLRICNASAGQGAWMYAGNGAIPDDKNYPHAAQTLTWTNASGAITEYVVHIDDDIFDSVRQGSLSMSAFANLLLHEGMHTVIDPNTGNGYAHDGAKGEPYPQPFSLVHSDSRRCVN